MEDFGDTEQLLADQVGLPGWWWNIDLQQLAHTARLPLAIVFLGLDLQLGWTLFVAIWVASFSGHDVVDKLDELRRNKELDRLIVPARILETSYPDHVTALQRGDLSPRTRKELQTWIQQLFRSNATWTSTGSTTTNVTQIPPRSA